MDYLVPIIIGSESDLEFGLKIQQKFKRFLVSRPNRWNI